MSNQTSQLQKGNITARHGSRLHQPFFAMLSSLSRGPQSRSPKSASATRMSTYRAESLRAFTKTRTNPNLDTTCCHCLAGYSRKHVKGHFPKQQRSQLVAAYTRSDRGQHATPTAGLRGSVLRKTRPSYPLTHHLALPLGSRTVRPTFAHASAWHTASPDMHD